MNSDPEIKIMPEYPEIFDEYSGNISEIPSSEIFVKVS